MFLLVSVLLSNLRKIAIFESTAFTSPVWVDCIHLWRHFHSTFW